jgi:hypothetical protein
MEGLCRCALNCSDCIARTAKALDGEPQGNNMPCILMRHEHRAKCFAAIARADGAAEIRTGLACALHWTSSSERARATRKCRRTRALRCPRAKAVVRRLHRPCGQAHDARGSTTCTRSPRRAEAKSSTLHTAARTTQPCVCERRILSGITFDMSGDRRHTKCAVGRPLDGGVSPHAAPAPSC